MIKVIFILFFLLIFPSDTKAVYDVIDVRCTNSLKTSLREEANDFTYRFSKKEIGNEVVYTSYFYNVSDNIDLIDDNGNKYNKTQIDNLKQGTTLTINVVASNNTYCSGYKIITKTIKVPYYNKYYGTDLCKGYEDILLCSENEKILYDEEEFIMRLKNYKRDNTYEKEDENKEDENEVVIQEKDFFSTYGHYIIGGILLLTIGILIKYIVDKIKNKGIL